MVNRLVIKNPKFYRVGLIVLLGISFAIGLGFGLLSQSPDIEELQQDAKDAYYAGNLEDAVAYYKKVVRHQPGLKAHLNLATIFEELGEYDLARKQYEEYLHYHPLDLEVHLDLAITYYNLGKMAPAREKLGGLLASSGLTPALKKETALYLSKIELLGEDFAEAHRVIDEALKADSRYAQAMVLKGDIYSRQGQHPEAIAEYLRALQIDGSLVGINRLLGLLYLEVKDYEKSYDRFERALRENGKDKVVQDKINWLEEEFPGRFKKQIATPEPKALPKDVTFRRISPAPNAENVQKVRVALAGGAEQKVTIFRVGSDFQIKDEKGTVLGGGKRGEIWKGEFLDDGRYELVQYPEGKPIYFTSPIRIEPLEYAPILVHRVVFGQGYYWAGQEDRQYRGQLELMPKPQGITLVNIVNVEEYLYSVVPSEMPASWPMESLKVQAVAARTYTYFHFGRFRAQGYDLCDTVRCAAYNGIGWENTRTSQAVNETAGLVMTYDGKPINAVYSANSGGHTENVKDVWGFELPYLQGVPTVKAETHGSFPLDPADLKRWLRDLPESYSFDTQFTNQLHYRWERRITRQYLEDRWNIGELQELIVVSRGIGGSVTAIKAIGTEGERELRSTLRSELGGLRSNRFIIRPEYENGKVVAYVFYGGGWGHSAGMDQVASGAMGKAGYTFDQILKHFYTGIDLVKQY